MEIEDQLTQIQSLSTEGHSGAAEIVERIHQALDLAVEALKEFTPGHIRADQKSGGRGPVTEADYRVSEVLRAALVRGDEGWCSEEGVDGCERLARRRVWIVDPVDGTRDFIAGVPEWSVSVGLVEDGRAVAGGVVNPSTGELFLGSLETGATYNGRPVHATDRTTLEGALVLASRREVERGEWEAFRPERVVIRSLGSVAYKLALVAAGMADATWTFAPKNEWDLAAGVALVHAAGGFAGDLGGSAILFNKKLPRVHGLAASGSGLKSQLLGFLARFDHRYRGA